jgi:iron complex transport system substrate-binding protein
MSEHRIVSLIASATELVAALGFEEALVGRSHECDFPPCVESLPKCSSSKVDASLTSGQIDTQVKTVLRDAVSVYNVDVGLLDTLAPTVVITQSQCEVCAVSLADVEAAVCEMVASKPDIVSLEPMCLADVWKDIHRVAVALDARETGEELVSQLQARLDAIAERIARLSARPRVACLEWIDPLMAAGNWVPELLELAGGENLFGTAGEHSPWMTWGDLLASDPDAIVVLPCGFDIERTRVEMKVLTDDSRWSSLRAVREGEVYLTDGNQYFNRPGPRLVESAEIFAEIFHPDQFSFGHENTGWVRLGAE